MSSLFVQKVKFQPIPSNFINEVRDWVLGNTTFIKESDGIGYNAISLYDAKMFALERWLKENVMDTIWTINVFTRDSIIHKDKKTSSRLSFYIESGHKDGTTDFISDDGVTILEQHKFPLEEWIAVKTDVWHRIRDIPEGSLRIFVGCRLFGYEDEYSPEHKQALERIKIDPGILRRFIDRLELVGTDGISTDHIPTHALLTASKDIDNT